MPLISTEIEIRAAPGVVREKFLTFPTLPTYSPGGQFGHITPDPTTHPTGTGHSVAVGETLSVTAVGAGTFAPVVTENSPTKFSWLGALPWGVFSGEHFFRFERIEGGGEGEGERTRFVHGEEFTGMLGWVMGEGAVGMGSGLRERFEGFNRDLKRWVEEGEQSV